MLKQNGEAFDVDDAFDVKKKTWKFKWHNFVAQCLSVKYFGVEEKAQSTKTDHDISALECIVCKFPYRKAIVDEATEFSLLGIQSEKNFHWQWLVWKFQDEESHVWILVRKTATIGWEEHSTAGCHSCRATCSDLSLVFGLKRRVQDSCASMRYLTSFCLPNSS